MLRRLVSTYGATLVANLLALGALIASVRILGNQANGQLVFAYYLASTTVSLAILGQRSGHIYFTARGDVSARTALSNALLYALGVGAAAAVVVLLLSGAYPAGPWRVLPPSALWALCAAVPLVLLRELFLAVARALGSFVAFNLNRPLIEFSRFLVVVVLGGGLQMEVAAVIAGAFALEALFAIALAASVWLQKARGFAPSWSAFKQTQHFSSPSAVVVALSMLHRNIDKFLIPWLMTNGAQSLTHYHIAIVALSPLNLLTEAISAVVLPSLAGASDDDAASRIARLARVLLVSVLLVGVSLSIVAWPLIGLFFGASNQPAFVPMLLLLPGVAGLVITSCMTSYLSSRRDFRFWILVSGAALITNVALNLAFIPRFGVPGVAVATSLTYLFESVALLAYVARRSQTSVRSMLLLHPRDIDELRRYLKEALRSRSGSGR